MNEAVVNSMFIINGLNKVDGFDPSAFLRRLTGENGEEQFYLDVKYRKLWFRLMHPEGKITKRIIKLENEFAIIESRVYLNRNDTIQRNTILSKRIRDMFEKMKQKEQKAVKQEEAEQLTL